jgi:hypothetical protein
LELKAVVGQADSKTLFLFQQISSLMNKTLLASALCVTLASTSMASTFSVSGAGGSIIDASNGPVYPGTMPAPFFSSPVTLANPVTSITNLQINGLTHTWIGDTHAVLRDPLGAGHNVWVRPAYLNTSTFGNSGDFLGGSYVFVSPGTPGALQLPTSSAVAVNPAAGTYEQAFGFGGAAWNSGTGLVDNLPFSSVTGPAGVWTLEIYDWAGGDVGSLTGWTLNGTDGAAPVTAECFGDTALDCPCSGAGGTLVPNPGAPGRGCANTSYAAGALLTATGNAVNNVNDTLVLTCTDLSGPGLFFQSLSLITAFNFGDGKLCAAGGGLLRLGVVFPTAGVAAYPGGLTPAPIHLAGAPVLGGGSPTADTRHYQCWYRDIAPTFCNTGGYNLSNGLAVVWAP